MYHILTNNIISNGKTLQGEALLIDGSRIIDRGTDIQKIPGVQVINLRHLVVMPGFIDTHVHGGAGFDVMDGTYESLEKISAFKLEEGCTAFCPTTITAPPKITKKAIKNIRSSKERGVSGAKIIGAFIEGPYINAEYKGAHDQEHIRPVNLNEIKGLLEVGSGAVKSIAIAPELTDAIPAIKTLTKMGIQVRLGHTAATIEIAEAAIAAGANAAIHTFNQMSPIHHREPGMSGAVLSNENIMAELICDLVHIHPKICKVLTKAKNGEGVILVTDAMAAAGLSDGEYKLGGLTVQVSKGEPRMPNGALAGSTATMISCVRNMIQEVGVPFEVAVQMATATPAKTLGVFDTIGSLDIGKSADIIGVDSSSYEVCFVMVDGIIKKSA